VLHVVWKNGKAFSTTGQFTGTTIGTHLARVAMGALQGMR